MKDAAMNVELHDRMGRVTKGRGMFVSGIGEFAVLKSIIEPAMKDPYEYLVSFKTIDNRPLNSVKFSHCEKSADYPLCYYKADYIPYRKVSLGDPKAELKKNDSELIYHEHDKKFSTTKVELHPDKKMFWSTPATSNGMIPGTLLLNKKNEPTAIVTDKRMRDASLAINLKHCGGGKDSGGFAPLEQQSTDTLPKYQHKAENNMLRMVADVNRMSEEQIKKALEELFVPGGMRSKSNLKKRQDNNRFSKTNKEEVAVQASSRGDEARREFFKIEAKASEVVKEIRSQDEEIGKLEKKLKSKETIKEAVGMKVEAAKEEMIAASVKLEVGKDTLSGEEKEKLTKELGAAKKKMDEAMAKAGKLEKEIGELKQKLAGLKQGLASKQAEYKKLEGDAKKSVKENSSALEGAANYRGDLL
tara:strand:- start:6712 stop:7959 length:1248 start_codon:yes stop_codon:yes gene_type:complete